MYYDVEKDELRMTISSFVIKIYNDGEIEIPFHVFLMGNVRINSDNEIKFNITLQEEYLEIIEKFFEKKWFTFDSKNYLRSDDVRCIRYNDDKNIRVINPVWKDNVLVSYKNIVVEKNEETIKEKKLLLEKNDMKLKSFEKMDSLKKYILK